MQGLDTIVGPCWDSILCILEFVVSRVERDLTGTLNECPGAKRAPTTRACARVLECLCNNYNYFDVGLVPTSFRRHPSGAPAPSASVPTGIRVYHPFSPPPLPGSHGTPSVLSLHYRASEIPLSLQGRYLEDAPEPSGRNPTGEAVALEEGNESLILKRVCRKLLSSLYPSRRSGTLFPLLQYR